MRCRLALLSVAALAVPVVVSPAPLAASAPERVVAVEHADHPEIGDRPEIGALADALPPGARQALSALRVLKGLSARNRVYREAGSVQGDLRAYYDAQIATAQRQLIDREQLGLHNSQVRAYQRVVTHLRAERDAALGVTEDEKRAAKFGFESQLVRELTSSLIRMPRVRDALGRMRETVEELRSAVEQARTAIASGNPIAAALADVRERIDQLDRYADIASLVSGDAGRALGSVRDRVQGVVDELQRPLDEAVGAADQAMGQLDVLVDGIDAQLEAGRSMRADVAVREAAATTIEQIFAPRSGGGSPPQEDIIADAVARGHSRSLVENVGVAVGELDPAEFNRMRDRVHAAMLGRTLERIGDICGRLIGAGRRAQLSAAAGGEPAPDTSTPCTLFGDPQALQDLIDADRNRNSTTTTIAGALDTLPPPPPVDDDSIDGAWTGTFDIAAIFGDDADFDGAGIEANEATVVVVAGVVQSLSGQIGFGGPCEEGPDAGNHVALYWLVDGGAATVAADESNGWTVTLPTTLTIDARGQCRCPSVEEGGGFCLEPVDMEGAVAATTVLTFSTGVATFEITSDEEPDDGALIGTLTRG